MADGPTGRRLRATSFVVTTLVALCVYLSTVAPTVVLVDAGELALAVREVAPGHPPGFPLYILLAQIPRLLPGDDLAHRLALFSAVCQALAMGVSCLLYLELLEPHGAPAVVAAARDGRGRGRRRRLAVRPVAAVPQLGPAVIGMACVAGALSLACARSVWRWAEVTEVYGLHMLLLAVAILATVRAAARPSAPVLAAAGLCQGLAAANHLSAVIYAFVLTLFLLARLGRALLRPAPMAALAAGWAVGVSPYLLLVAWARRDPLFNWGNAIDLERFLRHVTGWQYQVNLVFRVPAGERGRILADNVRRLGAVAYEQQWPVWMVAGLVGICLLRGWRRGLTIGLVSANVAYAVSYQIAEDWDAYFYPLFLLLGLGVARLLLAMGRRSTPVVVGMAAVVLVAVPLVGNHGACDHRGFDVAPLVVRDHLDALPKGALVLTREWQFYAPSLYQQHLRGYRPDVTVLDVELMRRSWYYRYVERVAPDLAAAAAAEIGAFRELLVPFERDEPFDAARLQTLYLAILDRFIEARRGRVYVGMDMESGVTAGRVLVPRGLLFEVRDGMPATVPDAPSLVVEERLMAGGLPAAEGLQKIVALYAAMRANRAIFLALAGRNAGAREQIDRALAIDPSNETVHAVARRLRASGG